MFEAIAYWYLQKKQERRALMEHLANTPASPPRIGGLAQLNRNDYGQARQTTVKNMMVRVVAINNGYIVATDEDPFESMVFCKDAEAVSEAVTNRAACFVLEK